MSSAKHPCAGCEQPTDNKRLCSLCAFREEMKLLPQGPQRITQDPLLVLTVAEVASWDA